MSVASIYKDITSCMFVGLDCVNYLVNGIVMLGLCEGLLCVGECKWRGGVPMY